MWQRAWRGYRATIPIALSLLPFGIAYGTVAVRSMAPWQTQLMSLTVFAGTAQFVSASMLAQGTACLPALLTGLLLNLRLLLMSAALAPYVASAPRAAQPALAHLLTDESFAVSIAEFEERRPDWAFFLGSGLAIYSFWQAATLVGWAFGAAIPTGFGLEYALSASLICLLFLLVRGRRAFYVALGAAALSVALVGVIPETWNVMAATMIAATVGAAVKR